MTTNGAMAKQQSTDPIATSSTWYKEQKRVKWTTPTNEKRNIYINFVVCSMDEEVNPRPHTRDIIHVTHIYVSSTYQKL